MKVGRDWREVESGKGKNGDGSSVEKILKRRGVQSGEV